MKPVTKNDIPEMSLFMADLWTFIKNWYQPESGNQWNKDMWGAAAALREKYKKDELVSAILTGLCVYLTNKWRKNGRL